MTSVTDRSAHSAERSTEHTIDIHTTAGKLAELHKRREESLHPSVRMPSKKYTPRAS